MSEKTTYAEIIKKIVNNDVQSIDNSICGKCSRCGECCTPFLPVSLKEINIIADYVITNNIKPQSQILVMENKLSCPYYDGKKCLIYEVRPLICKEFFCNKKSTAKLGQAFQNDKYYPIDMWKLAKDIGKI